jgi:hypothetical protein
MHFICDMLMQPECDGVTSNLYTFCGFQYKRVPHHGSLRRERFSRFQISTEAYLGGM